MYFYIFLQEENVSDEVLDTKLNTLSSRISEDVTTQMQAIEARLEGKLRKLAALEARVTQTEERQSVIAFPEAKNAALPYIQREAPLKSITRERPRSVGRRNPTRGLVSVNLKTPIGIYFDGDTKHGCFVIDMKANSPAAKCGKIKKEMRILSINGKNVEKLEPREILKEIKASGDECAITLVPDVSGYSAWREVLFTHSS